MSVDGFSHVDGFVTFDVVSDTNTGHPILILIDLVQQCGSAGSRGVSRTVGFAGVLPPAGIGVIDVPYVGVGAYTVPLATGGGNLSDKGLPLGASVVVRISGLPVGRVVDLVIDGAITAGAFR